MDKFEMLGKVDHTQLKAFATWSDIQKLCEEAMEYKTASVCIPPCYVKRVHDQYKDLEVCTVIGFPLGYCVTEAKVVEAKQAILDGATEIDMVVNVSDVKNGDFDKVESEIKALRDACGDNTLKVIIETCYLTTEEKVALCKAVTNAKADYIKTSTGFGTAGAQLEDIELFKANIGPDVKIKAAGGIRDQKALEAFINAGCDRIGCSAAADIARNYQ